MVDFRGPMPPVPAILLATSGSRATALRHCTPTQRRVFRRTLRSPAPPAQKITVHFFPPAPSTHINHIQQSFLVHMTIITGTGLVPHTIAAVQQITPASLPNGHAQQGVVQPGQGNFFSLGLLLG